MLIHKLTSALPKGRVGSGIAVLAGGTVGAQIVTVCAMPIVTRLYTPAEIGVISLFIAFFSFWSVLLSWRYESALLIAANDAESHLVFRVGVACVVLMSLLALPLLFILTRLRAFGFGLLPSWSALAGIPIFLGYGIFMMYRAWGLRAGLVNNITKATIARSGSNAVVRIILGLVGGGIPGLFAAEFAGAWGPAITLHHTINKHYSTSRPLIKWQSLKAVASRYSKFAKYELPSTALDQFALTIPVPMIAFLYGVQAAGWFGLARLLVALPNAQIGRAVGDVFQMELGRKVREREFVGAKQLFYGLLRKLSLFGLIPFVALMILAPWLVPWVFGKPWAEMGIIVACIAPWLYAAFVVSTLSQLLSVLQRQEYKFIYDLTIVILLAIVYVSARLMTLNLIETVILLASAYIVGYVVYLCVLLQVMSRAFKAEY